MQSREEMKNTAIYEKLINAVKQYFAHKDIYSILLHGGCYWLTSALHEYIPDSDIVFHRQMQHCACAFNRGVYDVRGRISARGFRIATVSYTHLDVYKRQGRWTSGGCPLSADRSGA